MRGLTETGFEAVADVFGAAVPEDGPGGAFAVYVDGTPVVDLVGGRVGDTDRRWDADTTCLIASGTKGIVATVMLMLLERGQLEPNAPVARYWPEFAAAGKEAIRVADVVAHTAGLPGIVAPIELEQVADPPSIEAALAAQAPIVPVGQPSYHALTYGWLCDALVRHVDGRSVGRFVADEIAGPLGLDLSIGTPPERIARIAPWRPTPDYQLSAFLGDEPPDPRLDYVYRNPPIAGRMGDRELLACEIPGGNAVSTSTAMARLYACLACGGTLGGVRVLDAATVELGRRQLSVGADPLSGRLLRFGVGFELNPNPSALGPDANAFGHTGAGGSSHGAWPGRRVGFSFVTSELRPETNDGRARRLLAALDACCVSERPGRSVERRAE
ncbi:MAG: serine hydrolase domain-containing protein [Ilumatobacteraceae bacterium]